MTTLARLSFWVPAARLSDFEAAYRRKLLPLLEKHGLEESAERGRPTVEGVFSRLFEVETPAAVIAKQAALQEDPAWQGVLRELGTTFGTTGADDPRLRHRFGLYRAPAGPGKVVEAGPGFRQKLWHSFSVQDGLPVPTVHSILQDREGDLWFGGPSICRYDGAQFTTFTSQDGLAGTGVRCILEDQQGDLWFGTEGGVSRYDGRYFTTFTQADGLAHGRVYSIAEDRQGNLWFGGYIQSRGVSRYDGERFVTFTAEDGLADHVVRAICEDRQGNLWFGTPGGASRYDGKEFKIFAGTGGLDWNGVSAILEDQRGHLWFGTSAGVSRYDGERFTIFTTEHGLAYNGVTRIAEDREGVLWFSTYGGGVSRYDGRVFQTLHKRNGLPHDGVHQVLQDRRGDFWIATDGGGITRYRPGRTPPQIRLTAVSADQPYGAVEEIRLPASQKLVVFAFQGRSWTTPADDLAYLYRLEGRDEDWRTTRGLRGEYRDLVLGEYTFQVKAVDRDLNYSEPATVRLSVVPDPRLEALTEALSRGVDRFVGDSPSLRRVQAQLAQVASTELTVMILGETGTGKGLAARMVHGMSRRKSGPFIQVNCGAIPQGLVESELFGHEKGAFTGAVSRKIGKVELAEGGTLFLDEIGDMPLEAQVKLLRLLEERTFERVGGTETLSVEVRVVAATNRDLEQMVARGEFREDLYFRLQVFPVRLPPLRERQEDITKLAAYFAARMAAHLDKQLEGIAPEALAALRGYEWPGNVRELEHAVQRAVVICSAEVIRAEDLALGGGWVEKLLPAEVVPLEEVERRYIREVLEKTGWVIKGPGGAAALLGVPPSTLRDRMRKLGIARR